MKSVCVGLNLCHSDGTNEYVAVEGWNFKSPDQLFAMVEQGVISDYSVGQNRDGDKTYHVESASGWVDKAAFNAFQWE